MRGCLGVAQPESSQAPVIDPGLLQRLSIARGVSGPADPSSHVAACVRRGVLRPLPARPVHTDRRPALELVKKVLD